jgi:NTE family protein
MLGAHRRITSQEGSMGTFAGRFVRGFLREWPRGAIPKVASLAAKLVIVAHVMVLAIVAGIVIGLPLLAVIVFVAFWFPLLLLLVNALLRWFRDEGPAVAPAPMPSSTKPDCRLERVLGPFNSQEGLRLYDAVFEGGGAKAIAQIGALACFHEAGLRPRKIIATSGGAIVGAFLLAGGSAEQIWSALARMDLTRILDPRWLPNPRWLRRSMFGLAPLIPGMVWNKGGCRGDAFERLMQEELLNVTPVSHPSFSRYRERQAGERHPVELELIATDVTLRRALALPGEIADYDGWQTGQERGAGSEELSVARAVRMSMSIPFVFEPVRLIERENNLPVDVVDGGLSSNYPIRYFDSHVAEGPRFPTFGFLLDERLSHSGAPKKVRGIADFASHVVQAGIGAIDRILTEHDDARTIRIPTLGVGTIDFDVPPEKQKELFLAGYDAAKQKLETFSWPEYVREFRGGRASIPEGAAGGEGTIEGVEYRRRTAAPA